MLNIIIQILGYMGLIVVILSFQKKERNQIIYYHLVSTIFYFLHFFLLGALTGAYMNLLGMARSYVYYKRDSKAWANKVEWVYAFVLIFIIAGILTWKDYYSLLPLMAMVVGTISSWTKNARTIRIVFLLSRPLWLIYNFKAGSVPGVVTELILICSISVGILRYDVYKDNQLFDKFFSKMRDKLMAIFGNK